MNDFSSLNFSDYPDSVSPAVDLSSIPAATGSNDYTSAWSGIPFDPNTGAFDLGGTLSNAATPTFAGNGVVLQPPVQILAQQPGSSSGGVMVDANSVIGSISHALGGIGSALGGIFGTGSPTQAPQAVGGTVQSTQSTPTALLGGLTEGSVLLFGFAAILLLMILKR